MLLSFLLDKLFCPNACWYLDVIKDYWAHMSGQKKRVLVRRNGPNVLKCFAPMMLTQHCWSKGREAYWSNDVGTIRFKIMCLTTSSTDLCLTNSAHKGPLHPSSCPVLVSRQIVTIGAFVGVMAQQITEVHRWCKIQAAPGVGEENELQERSVLFQWFWLNTVGLKGIGPMVLNRSKPQSAYMFYYFSLLLW